MKAKVTKEGIRVNSKMNLLIPKDVKSFEQALDEIDIQIKKERSRIIEEVGRLFRIKVEW